MYQAQLWPMAVMAVHLHCLADQVEPRRAVQALGVRVARLCYMLDLAVLVLALVQEVWEAVLV
jgi:hypothetical protein